MQTLKSRYWNPQQLVFCESDLSTNLDIGCNLLSEHSSVCVFLHFLERSNEALVKR
jgi:hypothetical protein